MRVPFPVQSGWNVLCWFSLVISLVSCGSSVNPGTLSPAEQILSVLDLGGVTKVKDIEQKSPHFSVHVKGKITAIAPFASGLRAFEVQDETGRIWIVTKEKVPSKGSAVVVKGTVRHKKISIAGQDQSTVYLEQNGTLTPVTL